MRFAILLILLAACSKPRHAELHLYPERIERYERGEAGGYVVHPTAGADAAARTALIAALAPADPDDIVGDGVVMWLTDAERAQIAARPDVGSVTILQPAERRADRAATRADVRIDLFAGTDDAERDAVAAWIQQRGGTVAWRGPAALRARAPDDAIRDLARLGPVRWVE